MARGGADHFLPEVAPVPGQPARPAAPPGIISSRYWRCSCSAACRCSSIICDAAEPEPEPLLLELELELDVVPRVSAELAAPVPPAPIIMARAW